MAKPAHQALAEQLIAESFPGEDEGDLTIELEGQSTTVYYTWIVRSASGAVRRLSARVNPQGIRSAWEGLPPEG